MKHGPQSAPPGLLPSLPHATPKQNASLACSSTRTPRTQGNHFFLPLCAFVKLETLKLKTQCGHFALKQGL